MTQLPHQTLSSRGLMAATNHPQQAPSCRYTAWMFKASGYRSCPPLLRDTPDQASGQHRPGLLFCRLQLHRSLPSTPMVTATLTWCLSCVAAAVVAVPSSSCSTHCQPCAAAATTTAAASALSTRSTTAPSLHPLYRCLPAMWSRSTTPSSGCPRQRRQAAAAVLGRHSPRPRCGIRNSSGIL